MIGLISLGLSPAGRPLGHDERPEKTWAPARTLVIAAFALLILDLLPPIWIGVGFYVVVLAVGAWCVVRVSRTRTSGLSHVTALGVAATVERTLTGFFDPLPPGVGMTQKVLQSVVLLGLVAAVSGVAWRKAAATTSRSQGSDAAS